MQRANNLRLQVTVLQMQKLQLVKMEKKKRHSVLQ